MLDVDSLDAFRTLIEESADAIFVVDPDGTVQYVSSPVTRILGYDPETLIGVNSFDHIHPEDEDRAMAEFTRMVEEPNYRPTVEFRFEDPDGSWLWLEGRGRNLLDDSDIRGLVIAVRDVTQRKAWETTLRFQKSLLEAQQEASLDGILVVDDERNIVSYNERFVELFDIPEAVLNGESDRTALEAAVNVVEDPDSFTEKIEYLYENPQQASHDQLVLTDGRIFDRYSAPVTDDTTYYGRVWFFRDVTERIEAQRQLEEQNERLEEFASVISHDLRNPLNTAMGRFQLINEEYDDESLEPIERALDRMNELINDVLTLTRRGAIISELEAVPLAEIIETARVTVGSDTLTLSIGDDLGTIRCDRSRACELMENLLRNAVEHAGPDVTVTIDTVGNAGFFVADDGPGIPPADREQVFEAGYSTQHDGTGLGLSIVEQIAEAHGWTFELVESVDGGARFEFRDVEFV